jgi:hypothetical protein
VVEVLGVSNGGPVWDAFVDALLACAPAQERQSRYGSKPALVLHGREIAHLEAPGVIDLRVTREGWACLPDWLKQDPRVRRERGRRDWVELRLNRGEDLKELSQLLDVAVESNQVL